MKAKIFTKKNFTLKDLINITRNCSLDAIILNSCMYPEYTAENIEESNKFQALDFYNEQSYICAEYSFNEDSKGLNLGSLIDKGFPLKFEIWRDVEDRFVYSPYDNIVYTKNIIILC